MSDNYQLPPNANQTGRSYRPPATPGVSQAGAEGQSAIVPPGGDDTTSPYSPLYSPPFSPFQSPTTAPYSPPMSPTVSSSAGQSSTVMRSVRSPSVGRTALPAAAGPARAASSPVRVVGVTLLVLAVASTAFALILHAFLAPSADLNLWFSGLVTSSHAFSLVPHQDGIYQSYAPMMFLLVNVTPLGLVAAYWLALRRFFRDRGPRTIGTALVMGFVVMLVAFLVAGLFLPANVIPFADPHFQPATPFWPLITLAYYPILGVIVLAIAMACGALSVLFASQFARWPVERMRQLQTDTMRDFVLVMGASLAIFAIQMLLYSRSPVSNGNVPGYWWLPASAILITIYASFDALRPMKSL